MTLLGLGVDPPMQYGKIGKRAGDSTSGLALYQPNTAPLPASCKRCVTVTGPAGTNVSGSVVASPCRLSPASPAHASTSSRQPDETGHAPFGEHGTGTTVPSGCDTASATRATSTAQRGRTIGRDGSRTTRPPEKVPASRSDSARFLLFPYRRWSCVTSEPDTPRKHSSRGVGAELIAIDLDGATHPLATLAPGSDIHGLAVDPASRTLWLLDAAAGEIRRVRIPAR